MANEKLRLKLVQHIINERAEKTTDDFYHELRMELYVASPKQFWEIVHEEAEKIAMRYMRT